MAQSRTRQLTRALRIGRSPSLSYAQDSTSAMAFSRHFARTSASTLSPSSATCSPPSSVGLSLRDSGYASSSSSPMAPTATNRALDESGAQTNVEAATLSFAPLPSNGYVRLQTKARFSSAFASRTLNRHASFTPVDTRFNATSAAVAHTLPRAPTHAAPSQPPPPPPRPLQPPPPPFSLSSAYNPQPLRAPIATAVELSSSPTTSTTTLQQSYRSAFTAKCRRSSSLMSRYKPKLLRFAPDSACVLNIYVADANSSSARADPTQKGILKNAARPSPPLQQSRDQTRHSRSPTMRQRASDARSRSHGPIGAANDNDDGDNDHDEFELESLESLSDTSAKAPSCRPPPLAHEASTVGGEHQVANRRHAPPDGSSGDSPYKLLYENAIGEIERLQRRHDAVRSGKSKRRLEARTPPTSPVDDRSLSLPSASVAIGSSPTTTPPLDANERRAYERRIAELEYELQKRAHMAAENERLKSENEALIRVLLKTHHGGHSTPFK